MLSTQSTNPFNSTTSNHQHHDLNESGILSDQQQLNNKTPTDTAVEASRQEDDDDTYVVLDDSDEENSTTNGNQESAQSNGLRSDPADSPADRATDSAAVGCDDYLIQAKQEPKREHTDQQPEQHEADDDDGEALDSLCEIIDGIMFYTFQTNEELRQFTIEDEKGRQAKKETKYGSRKSNGKGTATYSAGRRKSSIAKQQPQDLQSQDSAFISPELDDYLSKKFKNDRARLTGHLDDENEISLSESFDSSFGRKSKGKSTKKSTPEIVPVNEAISELDDDERIDNDAAYRMCLKSVERAYNSFHERMRGKFKPLPLDDQRVREALGALHQNFISTSIASSIYSSSAFDCSTSSREAKRPTVEYSELGSPPAFAQELDLDRARSNLENISKSDKDIHFKLEPSEEDNLKEMKLKLEADEQLNQLNQSTNDKQQPKKKNRNEEEGYDITRIISKHSKRDIRLPARFHESGILVGSQWILPHFDEDKSRSNRKQPTSRKKPVGRPPKSDLANSNHSFETTSPAAATVNQLESEPLIPENLMSEDEDSMPSNELSSASNLASNNLSTSTVNSSISAIDHDKSSKKRNFLKYLWRELFYANNAKRRQYYLERAILPRVNKFEVIREGCRTIENLKKQVKNRNYCENSLINWQNKLKLTLASIEKSNGSLSNEELNEIEKTLNSYRNNLRKLDQVLTEGKRRSIADHLLASFLSEKIFMLHSSNFDLFFSPNSRRSETGDRFERQAGLQFGHVLESTSAGSQPQQRRQQRRQQPKQPPNQRINLSEEQQPNNQQSASELQQLKSYSAERAVHSQ